MKIRIKTQALVDSLSADTAGRAVMQNGFVKNVKVDAAAAIVESKLAFDTVAGHNHDGANSKLISIAGITAWNEVPTGAINGVNLIFTLANTPPGANGANIMVFLNGLLQAPTSDYTRVTNTVTFVAAPETGDILLVTYTY